VRVHHQRHRVVIEIGGARVALEPPRGKTREERPQRTNRLEIAARTRSCRDLDRFERSPCSSEAERVLCRLRAGNGHRDSTLHQSGHKTTDVSADPAGARGEHFHNVKGVSRHRTPRESQDS
jgi:hypothetical protein